MFESLFADQASYTIGDEKFKKSDISLMGQFAGSERLAGILGTDPSNIVGIKNSMYNESQDDNKNNSSWMDRIWDEQGATEE